MTRILFLREQKLACVLTPKVASTTVLDFLYALAGITLPGDNPRKAMRRSDIDRRANDKGVEKVVAFGEEIGKLRSKRSDFFWMALKRDPLSRLISSYQSKIHRYAKKYDKLAYYRGSLKRFRHGLKAIDDSRYTSLEVSKLISFDDMVVGLQNREPSFDIHFALQTDIIAMDHVDYDMIIPQENLEQGLFEVCNKINHEHLLQNGLPQHNRSFAKEKKRVTLRPKSRKIINEVYARDFELLGYPKLA